MPNTLIDQIAPGQRAMVNEVIVRGWATSAQIETTIQAMLAGELAPLVHHALHQQRLIKHDDMVFLDQYRYTGEQIDDYIVKKIIGSGAMGDVLLGEHHLTGEQVAIKIINDRYASDHHFTMRFHKEVSILAQINHSNMVCSQGHGVHNGRPFVILDYVDGENLADAVQRYGSLPEAAVLNIAIQIATGLDFIFNKTELVHRDVKPENILINDDIATLCGENIETGSVKLIDFGLARACTEDDRLTMTGVTMGTPHYMSPEQVRGEAKLDHRCDQYGLCATMYHLLTGRTPYDYQSPGEVMTAHLTEPSPNPCQFVPGLKPATVKIIETGMAKRANDRFTDHQAFIHACHAALRQLGEISGPRLLRKPLVLSQAARVHSRADAQTPPKAPVRSQTQPQSRKLLHKQPPEQSPSTSKPDANHQAVHSSSTNKPALTSPATAAPRSGQQPTSPQADQPASALSTQRSSRAATMPDQFEQHATHATTAIRHRSDSIRSKGVAALNAEQLETGRLPLLPVLAILTAIGISGLIVLYRYW